MQANNWTPSIERLLLLVWVGSLLAIGYLAAPVLFYSLDDRQLAGQLAGRMFHIVDMIGIASALVLLSLAALRDYSSFLRQKRTYLLILMLLLTLSAMFVLQPQMEAIKAQAGWHEISQLKARFGQLHGIASVLYLLTSVIGVALVLTAERR